MRAEIMREESVSIGQVKRDISEMVNRVAYGQERIVLTSRGKPKAALISLEDYERLKRQDHETRMAEWQEWLRRADALANSICESRQGEYMDLEALERENDLDLEQRDDDHIAL